MHTSSNHSPSLSILLVEGTEAEVDCDSVTAGDVLDRTVIVGSVADVVVVSSTVVVGSKVVVSSSVVVVKGILAPFTVSERATALLQ